MISQTETLKYSEKQQQKDRDDAWAKVHAMAASNAYTDPTLGGGVSIKSSSNRILPSDSKLFSLFQLVYQSCFWDSFLNFYSGQFSDRHHWQRRRWHTSNRIRKFSLLNLLWMYLLTFTTDWLTLDSQTLKKNQQKKDFAEERPAPSRFRRKSVLPVDANVLTELARHKSLEDIISK